MKKLWGKIVALCASENSELKVRLFRSVLFLGEISCVISALANIALQVPFIVIAFELGACAFFALAFVVTTRLKDCTNLYMAMVLYTSCLLFPISFVCSGGMAGGGPAWLVFGIALTFVFMSGWRLYVTLGLTLFSMFGVYWLALIHPEMIQSLGSRRVALYSSYMAVLVIGILLGAIFYVEMHTYEKERRRNEEQRETIRRLSDSRNLFFASMSHEIRTPINTIIGLNEMTLREEGISPEVAENAVNIQNASKILLALINDILDLSKLESGKMEIVPAQYETGALLSDLVNIIWVRANEKGLAFHMDVDEELPSELYGDEVRIKQVLVNLLSNAVKYTHKGTVSLSIKSERIDTNHVLLKMAVRDTGIGIKSENIDSLFSSFQRVDAQKNHKIEGTGLGLSIAKQLVDMMHGTITVDSIYTKGSVFTVTVPQQIVSDKPIGLTRYSAMQNAKDRPKYNRRFEAPEARVLIVDDNEMNLMVARKLLRDTRVQIDTALSGEECLQKTMEQSYHVIFMDHIMPGMDGEATLKALRSRTEGFCQETPVIALTANVMSNAEEVYRAKGFDGYLSKPIGSAVFEAMLQKSLPPELITYTAEAEDGEIADRLSLLAAHSEKRKRVRITTDCVCDLPAELLEHMDVKVLHYYVTTKEGRFKDTTEISSANLLEYIKNGSQVESGPASVQEYESFFADNLLEAEQVLHISMTARVSEGFKVASTAAHGFNNVTVIDSGHLSSGLGMLVLCAAQLAQQGEEVPAICARLEALKDKVSTSFILATAENLYLSGRMDKISYTLGHVWHLHHVLGIRRGRMTLVRVYAGKMSSASRRYIRRCLRFPKRINDDVLFITYAGCTMAQLAEIRAEVENRMHFKHIYMQQATSAIAGNCGIGAFGLLYIKK